MKHLTEMSTSRFLQSTPTDPSTSHVPGQQGAAALACAPQVKGAPECPVCPGMELYSIHTRLGMGVVSELTLSL